MATSLAAGRATASTEYFSARALRFLEDLREHNQKEWFERNRTIYETQVRDPFLDLIADLRAPLKKINPNFVVDPRPAGGSMMRIYRDIRFSRDKSPYKTNVSAHFHYSNGKEGASPAYYLHLEPGRSMTGGGIWRPSSDALMKIRQAIVAKPESWRRATSGMAFGSSCGMIGESLKKAPRGFDPGHPLIEDLKRKDFAIGLTLTDEQVTGPDLLDDIAGAFSAIAPFVEFLVKAVEAPD
jgi:uncharacterized protein (TIGR02453 family)